MRPALRPRRLRMCGRCRWNRVQEQRRLWPLRFLRPRMKVRDPLALKPHRRTTRRRVDSSRDSADFLPRCFVNVPLTCPSVPREQAKFSAAPASISFFGVRVSTRILQTARKEEKMRIVWTLVSLLMILGSAAWAQIPTKGNVFFGYFYGRSSVVSNDTTNLNGWELTLEGKFLPWIGLVVDVDGHYGNHDFGGTQRGRHRAQRSLRSESVGAGP